MANFDFQMAQKPRNEHECYDVSLYAVILFRLLS